jgi:hypothetical protein
MRSTIASAFLLCITAGYALAQQNPMRPGRWEVTMQMQIPNAPVQIPPTTMTQCITEEQLKKDPGSGLPNGSQSPGGNACKVSDYKTSGNTVTWKMACTGQQAVTGDGEMTFTGDSYTGAMKMSMAQGAMAMKLSGKRLGDCTP